MQLHTAIEKRQLRQDEEEYERSQLREKLDEEVWEDLVIEEDNDMIELDVKDKDKNNEVENTEPLLDNNK